MVVSSTSSSSAPLSYELLDENAVVFGDDEIVKYDTNALQPHPASSSITIATSPRSLLLDSWWCPPPSLAATPSTPPSLLSVPAPRHFPLTSPSSVLSTTNDLKRIYALDFSSTQSLVVGGGHGGYVNVWSLSEPTLPEHQVSEDGKDARDEWCWR